MTTLDDDDDFDDSFWQAVVQIGDSQCPPHQPFPTTTNTTPMPLAPPQPMRPTTTTSSALSSMSVRAKQNRGRNWNAGVGGRGGGGGGIYGDCFSPPHEMSQRPPVESEVSRCGEIEERRVGNEGEIECVKEELHHLSKKLIDMEQECLKLRKEKEEKQQQIQSIFSRFGSAGAESAYPRNGTLDVGDLVPYNPVISVHSENQNTLSHNVNSRIIAQKTIGIQTDENEDFAGPAPKDDQSAASDLQKRLLTLWSSKSKNSRKSFVANLLEKCSSEFCALFGFSGLDVTSGISKIPELQPASHVKSINNPHLHSSETSKVSKLYAVLAEVGDETVPLQALLDVLLGLCSLKNVIVVHRSLQILHAVLDLLPTEKSCGGRENVKVQGLQTGSQGVDYLGFKGAGQDGISSSGLAPLKFEMKRAAFLKDNSGWDLCAPLTISQAEAFRVFDLMLHIAIAMSGQEHVQVEVVSIMNTIVVRSDAYTEREKFGDTTVFEAVDLLLKKETGLRLQEMALHLLYLLLNCPRLLAAFSSGFKDTNSTGAPNAGANTASVNLSCVILDGLGMCMSCCRNSAQGLHLCRRAIVVLAFLASSGKTGFEILLIHKLPSRTNFLGLILRVLVSEIDAESSENCSEPAICRERTLLLREALILLNRLASHPSYSPAVLKVLTSYGDMASLSIDVANRLSKRNSHFGRKYDDITNQMRESEVVDLARVFRKRIFVFLGESI